MLRLLKYLPEDLKERRWASILVALSISTPLVLWSIYVISEYGVALFILIPFLMGLSSTTLYGYGRKIRIKDALGISIQTLGLFSLGLILFAIEGLVCIIMAAPFGVILALLGGWVGYLILNYSPNSSFHSIFFLIFSIPTTAILEKDFVPPIEPVETQIIIDASPEIVWKNVIAFPELEAPEEMLFQVGISYPIHAKIEGTGVGAIRYCTFNTGEFVEPITEWNPHNRLSFDVKEQPKPLQELSFWDIDAPHLHDYFVSKKGQFELRQLPDDRTQLIGTTWYYHNIKPDFYWRIWSDYIIHKIHLRVLNHIKDISEKEQILIAPY